MFDPSAPSVHRLHHLDALDGPADLVLAELAATQHGRVAAWQLLPLGVTRSEIARRLEAGRLHREFRGVYAVGHPGATPEARRMAAVLACGPWSLLGRTSLCHHLGLLDGPGPTTTDVVVAGRSKAGQPGIRVHQPRRLGRDEVTVADRIPCTTTERLLADMAAVASDDVLATLAHRAQVRHLLRPVALAEQLARSAKGIERLRELIEPTGPDLRAELETRLHRFVRRGGWPAYEPNVLVQTPLGPFRADALWRQHGFALELDSWKHHGDRGAFEADRRRDVAADLVGIVVKRVTWRMLVGTPAVVEALLDHRVGRSSAPR